MTSITVANTDDTVLASLQTILANATVAGRSVFEDVSLCGSRQEAHDKKFTASPLAVLIYEATDVYLIADLEEGCVLKITVLVAVREDTPALRARVLSRCINAARNALNTGIPSNAHGFPDDAGDFHPRMMIGTPEREDDIEDPWTIAWLPVEVSYVISSRTTH